MLPLDMIMCIWIDYNWIQYQLGAVSIEHDATLSLGQSVPVWAMNGI